MQLSRTTTPAAIRVVARPPIPLMHVTQLTHVERLLARKQVVRVGRAVYARTEDWSELAPWQRYLCRVHAVALTHPDAIFCYESAAALWALPIFGDPGIVHILGGTESTSRLHHGIRTHTAAQRDDIVDLGGILATGRATTVLDIARSRHHIIGFTLANAALRDDATLSLDLLADGNESRPSTRGRRHARWVVANATALPETPLEGMSLAVLLWLGFERPALQIEFPYDGGVDRVDFWWEGTRVAGESDGDIKYDGSLGTEPLATIRAEKERDRRLLQRADGIAHWGWRDVVLVSPLRAEVLRAGLLPIRAEDAASLAGIAKALRSQ
ncbi:hypothetical protein GCM10028798_22820 [Humibacter antri]